MYNNFAYQRVDNETMSLKDCNYIRQWWSIVGTLVMIFLLTVFLSLPLGLDLQLTNVRAAPDIDISEDGKAAAASDKESIATDIVSFCGITNDIAGGKFSSLLNGIFDCNNNSHLPNQFSVEYSYTKNPVKMGEKTYLTITVRDKDTGTPVANAMLKLDILPPSTSFDANTLTTVLPAVTAPMQEVKKSIQTMYTDNNGQATFTVQVGPKSDVGIYDTELEVNKDSYQSNLEQINFYVIPQSEKVLPLLKSNNGDATDGSAIGGNGGAGGDAVGVAQGNASCDGTAIGGAGGNGGVATEGIQGMDGENGFDDMVIC
jgi:hypothetical protein